LYDFAPDAYCIITADGTLKSVNQSGAESLGYRKEELINTSAWNLIYEPDREWVQQQVATIFSEKLTTSEVELRKVRKDGSFFWVRDRTQLILDEGGTPVELLMICRDITELKQVEEQLRQNAFHDALTGLPNRVLFMDRLGQAVERVKRHEDYLFAVLFLDLDRFKLINDSLGHLLGDQLLIGIASRLKACLRPTDTVARLGGDEFTILLEDIKDVSDAIRIADRVEEELRLPFELDEQEVFTSASIGIALSSPGYDQPENLLRDADIAMYRAKSQGSARYEIFNPEMHARAVAILQMETDLRTALERQEFWLQYQAIVSLKTGRIIGFEALLRWQHPQYGLHNPVEFIAATTETRLLSRICQWLLREACSQLRKWQLQFPATPPLIVSVNLSSQQLTQTYLIAQISQILQETGLDASSLRLEITEGAIMNGAESADAILLQLKALGVQLSINSFGTGYSSLGRLHHLPINGLKIDRSFVSQTSMNGANWAIVETIVTLAHNLGVDVTAAGVETAEQLAQLRALECEYGQGNFFSPPLDSKAAEALIMANPRW
jgi:diguanylate cyclase (GGDEF)-like protein/PAS domain S-box-containing protein